jgi:hypothetical protein
MRSFVDYQDVGAQIIGDSLRQHTAKKTGADDEVIMFQFACHKVFQILAVSIRIMAISG